MYLIAGNDKSVALMHSNISKAGSLTITQCSLKAMPWNESDAFWLAKK